MSSFVASAEEGDQVAATVSNAGGLSEVEEGSTIATLAPGNHTSGVRDFFDAYVPDGAASEATDALRVFKGLVVLKLMKSDARPAYVGGRRDLMIGSLGAAYNRPVLDCYGVTHVLTVGSNIRPKFEDAFRYMIVPVKDTPSEDLGQHFNAAFEFIESAIAGGGRVLIHCFMGRSRSSTVVCAYLMRKHSMRLSEALQTLRATRPQAQPNAGFVAQLLALERRLLGPARAVGLGDDSEEQGKGP